MYELKNSSFMFALSIRSEHTIFPDETYFGLKRTQLMTDSKDFYTKIVALVNWTYRQSPGISQSKLEALKITNSLCPESMDFIVLSNTKLFKKWSF